MRDLPHLRVTANPTERPYVFTGTVVTRRTFRRTTVRSRVSHASHLKSQAWQATLAIHHRRRDAPPQLCFGQTLTFTGDAGIVEALEPFSRHREGLELLNVVVTPAGVRVTVHFQKGRLRQLDAMIRRYRVGSVSATTGQAPNAALLEGIERISLAAAADLWTEDRLPFPPDGRAVWWEAWLHLADATQDAAHARFSELLVTAGGRASGVWIAFPERIVVTAWATPEQLRGSFELLNCIAELRRASEPVVDYIDAPGRFQGELVAEAVGRVRPPGAGSPAVLLLDTGVDRGHPLLSAALAENDAQAVVTEWGGADHPQDKHGTGMAGIALYGDLTQLLTGDGEWRLRHRLESVKILPPAGRNDPPQFGRITLDALAKATVEAPGRNRVVCLTITDDRHSNGAPTAWSGYIDRICFRNPLGRRQLMVVSAGNAREMIADAAYDYPKCLFEQCGIEDPAQAWNVLTVGACTARAGVADLTLLGYKLIAVPGDLSPVSRTSAAWDASFHGGWPLKPDVVMEGGNYVEGPGGLREMPPDLGLLTTTLKPGRLLATTGDTSAAAASAARFAAILWSHYPNLWPETIRALVVHSASWTPAMQARLDGPQVARRLHLLRCYGYGVPDLETAIYSARSSAVLFKEAEIQPYRQDAVTGATRANVMHLHALPWPREYLLSLGERRIRMRVTLSYFVDADPERVATQSHRYQSYGLRFDVRRPGESERHFLGRQTKADWDDGQRPEKMAADPGWTLGGQRRGHGSLHCDWWTGRAADLADLGFIAVYPVTGWWRERAHLNLGNSSARYTLIASIDGETEDLEVYTAIQEVAAATQAAVPIEVQL